MRLGSWSCDLQPGSKIAQVYATNHINERHRHRFEFNNAYKENFESSGLKATGINAETGLVEVVELPEHPFSSAFSTIQNIKAQ